jgi:hypothetical protein
MQSTDVSTITFSEMFPLIERNDHTALKALLAAKSNTVSAQFQCERNDNISSPFSFAAQH